MNQHSQISRGIRLANMRERLVSVFRSEKPVKDDFELKPLAKQLSFSMERMEPRLLLSGESLTAAGATALVDSLESQLQQFAALVDQLETLQSFKDAGSALPLIDSDHSSVQGSLGVLLDFSKRIDDYVVSPLSTLSFVSDTTTGALATEIQSAINTSLSSVDNSLTATLIDNSTAGADGTDNGVADFTFSLQAPGDINLPLDFGALADELNITLPDSAQLNFDITNTLAFDTTVNLAVLAGDANNAQSAFTVSNISLGAQMDVSAELTGSNIRLGLINLTVGNGGLDRLNIGGGTDNEVDFGLNTSLTFNNGYALTGAQLVSKQAQIDSDTTVDDVFGSDLSVSVTGQTGVGNVIANIPVTVATDNGISGLENALTGSASIQVSADSAANLLNGNLTNTVTDELVPFSTFTASDIVGNMLAMSEQFAGLSESELMAIPLPFVEGKTVGDVVDIAEVFKQQLIDPLDLSIGKIGLSEGARINADSGPAVAELLSTELDFTAAITDPFRLYLELEDGSSAVVTWEPSDADPSIDSLNDLVAVLNTALMATVMKDRVTIAASGNKLSLKASATNNSDRPASITVKTAEIEDFSELGERMARAIGLGDEFATVEELLERLNLRYEDGAIKADVAVSYELPVLGDEKFEIDFDLGDLSSLTADGSISLGTEVGMAMTIGFDLTPLGEGDSVPADLNTKTLDSLPLWADDLTAVEREGQAGLADITIVSNSGQSFSVVIDPAKTVDQLIADINTQASNAGVNLTASYDADNNRIQLVDNSSASAQAPTDIGFDAGSLALPTAVSGQSGAYESVLLADAGSYDYNKETSFALRLGKLAPVVVTVDAGSGRDLADFVAALNAELAQLSLTLEQLGVSSSAVKSGASVDNWGQIIKASVEGGRLQLKTETHALIDTSAQNSDARAVLRATLGVEAAEFAVYSANGSLAGVVLGLVGVADSSNTIVGSGLDGENLGDRLFLENSSISALIDVSIADINVPSSALDISGKLGILDFEAKITEGYLSLGTTLHLTDTSGSSNVTLNELFDGIQGGKPELIKMVDVEFFSGRDDGSFANLELGNFSVDAGLGIDVSALGIDISLPTVGEIDLSDLEIPTPEIDIRGFDDLMALSELNFTNVVKGLQLVLDFIDTNMDLGFYDFDLPLVDLSLKDMLDFTADFAVKLDALLANPQLGLDAIEAEIEGLFGNADIFDLRFDANYQGIGPVILLDLDYNLLSYNEQLALNLDIAELVNELNDPTINALLENVGSLFGVGADGMVDVSVTGTLSALMGIRLSPATVPAALSTAISSLNDGKGIDTNGTDAADLRITLGNGSVLEFDADSLASNATIGDLVSALDALSADISVSFDNGQITLTDDSASAAPAGLSELGLTAGVTNATGDVLKVQSSDLSAIDPAGAFAFDIALNGGNSLTIAVDAEDGRSLSQLMAEIDQTIASRMVDRSALGLTGDGKVLLGKYLDASASGNTLVLEASTALLTTDGASGTLSITLAEPTLPDLAVYVESINGSQIAEAVGIQGKATGADNARELVGVQVSADGSGDRFFIDTDETGAFADVSIDGSDLNFQTNLGPIEIEVKNGTALLSGDDAEGDAASDAGFEVGDKSTNAATFHFGLDDDAKNGPGDSDSLMLFSEMEAVDSSYFTTSFEAGAEMLLPVYALGAHIGDLEISIGDVVNDRDARSIDIKAPDIATLLGDVNFLNNPEVLISGLDMFFASLDKVLVDNVLGFELPFVGDALEGFGNFVGDLRDSIIPALWEEVEEYKLNFPGQPVTTSTLVANVLQEQFDALGWGATITGNTDINSGILDFDLNFNIELFREQVALDADFGVPGLGLSVNDGAIEFYGEVDFDLGFGFGLQEGFFLKTADDSEIELVFGADFDAMPELSASLGILAASLKNNTASTGADDDKHTALTGKVLLDLNAYDPNNDGIMTYGEMRGQQYLLEARAEASAVMNLLLDAGVDGSVGISLPAVSTNLYMDYGITKVLYGQSGDSSTMHALEMRDIKLDAGEFFSGFLKPVLDTAWTIIEPVKPVIDFITDPLAGISSIMGPTSLLDLAELTMGNNPKVKSTINFIRMVDQVADLVEALNAMGSSDGSLIVDFGTYDFMHNAPADYDPLKQGLSGLELSEQNFIGGLLGGSGSGNALDGLGSVGAQLETLKNEGHNDRGSISVPVLTDPMQAMKLLTGNFEDLDLFLWDLPTFGFKMSHDVRAGIPGVPKLGLDAYISFSVDAGIDLAFGYDTSGFVKMMDSGNPLFLMDGFYVADTENGVDVPEAWFKGGVTLTGSVNAFLFEAGVRGSINGELYADLTDPNNDGKIRAAEILKLLEESPEYIFELEGKITAEIEVFFDVYINYLVGKEHLYGKDWDIIPETTLVDFSHDYVPEVNLGSQSGSTLTINMGDFASSRGTGDVIDGSESFFIRQTADGTIDVFASYRDDGNVAQRFTGVENIIVQAGVGDDVIVFDGVSEKITIDGGIGNDMIYLNGQGTASGQNASTASTGTVIIKGGKGDDQIYGGNGQDTIEGGDGNDTIFAGGGNDTIRGDSGNDTIDAGTGNDNIDGGSGDDVLKGDAGNDTIDGNTGNDWILAGAGNDIIDGGDGDDFIVGDDGTINSSTISVTATAGGNDTIDGGRGNDMIVAGAGNDIIDAGHGNNVVIGDLGTITFGVSYFATAETDTSNPSVGGNDTITGGSGQDVFLGGVGGDTIKSGSGVDVILGDNGLVEGPDGASTLGQFKVDSYVTSGSVLKDVIEGGSGRDVIIGGANGDEIDGGSGSDVIAGDEAEFIRKSAVGSLDLVSFTATDVTVGGDDTIIAAAGSNIVIGGAGADEIDARVNDGGIEGNNVLIGDFGTVLPAGSSSGGNPIADIVSGHQGNGGADTIYAAGGSDVLIGGSGTDTLESGAGNDVLLGDFGQITRDEALYVLKAESSDESQGDADIIKAGADHDIVMGGLAGDTIEGGDGVDVLLGDFGVVVGAATDGSSHAVVTGHNTAEGGDDTITAGGGDDVVVAGGGNDTVDAGADQDVVLGDNGIVTRSGITTYDSEAELDRVTGWTFVSVETNEESSGGNDTLTLGLGNDISLGGTGNDTLHGNDGVDVLLGDLGIVVPASGSTAEVRGRSAEYGGNDTINGDAGNDVIIGGGNNGGVDTIDGGTDHDLILGDNGEVTRDTEANGWVMLQVETTEEDEGGQDNITAGSGNDTVIAGTGDDTLQGNDGVDVLLGDLGIVVPANGSTAEVRGRSAEFGGNDTINGDAGNDVIVGGGNNGGVDTIDGGVDHDLILGDNGEVTRDTEANGWVMLQVETTEEDEGGQDNITAGSGNDTVIAGTGYDTLHGNDGVDVLLGDLGIVVPANGSTAEVRGRSAEYGGNDTINGDAGNDVIIGGGNNGGVDTIDGGTDHDLILGDNGEVTRDTEANGWAMLQVETTEEDEGGQDNITAGSGNDTVIAGTGDDTLHGNDGVDVLLGDLGIVVPANGSTAEVRGRSAEFGGNDTINGDAGNDVIIGGGNNGGVDTIDGGTDHDLILGDNGEVTRDTEANGWAMLQVETTEEDEGGQDHITAGSGDDIVIAGTDIDTVFGNDGVDVILGDLGIVVPADGTVRDIIGRNTSVGGDDVISGGAGNDVIMGNAGRDTIDGDAGKDVIFGDSGEVTRNQSWELLYASTVEVAIGDQDLIRAGSGDDVAFGGAAEDNISGNEDSDILFGDGGYQRHDAGWIAREMVSTDFEVGADDRIYGNDGDDYAVAGLGNDYLEGNDGRDTLIGDQGKFLWDAIGQRESVETVLEDGVTPVAPGYSDDELHGGAGNDNLFGGRIEDKLYGGTGSDILVGDEGNIFFRNDLEHIAQSKESFAGRADVMHLGTSAGSAEGVDESPDFLLGGEEPNYNYADTRLDMILHENAHVEISADRVGEWDEPPFLGDPVATTTDDFFALPGEVDDLIDQQIGPEDQQSQQNSPAQSEGNSDGSDGGSSQSSSVLASGRGESGGPLNIGQPDRSLLETSPERETALDKVQSDDEGRNRGPVNTGPSNDSGDTVPQGEATGSDANAGNEATTAATSQPSASSSNDTNGPAAQQNGDASNQQGAEGDEGQTQTDGEASSESDEEQLDAMYFDEVLGIWVVADRHSGPVINMSQAAPQIRLS